MQKINNHDIGFVSAQQIYNDVDIQEFDEITNKYTGIKSDDLFLSKDVYDWRCEQYKKYYNNLILFRDDYPNFYRLWVDSSDKDDDFDWWLFDFVINGGLDKK
jgi:hypothetical protein